MPFSPNLDALIPREDFDMVDSQPTSGTKDSIAISDLVADSFFYNALRKPDFQRETGDWSGEKICEFIRTFLDGDLIPAVILWKSLGGTFVIDGAHRLSALIAWVNNDYGVGQISIKMFDFNIIDEQRSVANKTRDLVAKEIGTYAEYQALSKKSDPSRPEQSQRAIRLGQIAVRVQWVTGDSRKAEESFYRINLSATPIDDTELSMIKARRKPNALATRAIVRAGSGHKYWFGFTEEVQEAIEAHARTIYDLLCNPPLSVPIKTLDVPAAPGYSPDTVRLIYDLINYLNGLRPEMWMDPPRKASKTRNLLTPKLPDDTDGSVTLGYMKTVKRIASRMIGEHKGSLGLHPAVYFYGATGKFQSTAFLAMVALVVDLEKRDKFDEFTDARSRFEDFLIAHRHYVNLVGKHIGAGTKGLDHLFQMYKIILAGIKNQASDSEIVALIQSDPRLQFIKDITEDDRVHGRNFSNETKSAAFIKAALVGIPRCGICHARLHVRSISHDHRVPRRDGGDGSPANNQLTHPYCNTGYKEGQTAALLKESASNA